MNVEQAFKITTTVAQMRKLVTQLADELDEVGASANQKMMAGNIDQTLSALEGSLRPIIPTDEDVAKHPARPRGER